MSGIQRKSVAKMMELDLTPLIVRLPMNLIDLDPDQPRQEGKHTPEQVTALGKSMRVKQLQPATVREIGDRYRIVIGEGRWRGADAEGLEYLDCVITEETDPVAIKVMQIVENLHRKDMSKLDYAQSFKDLLDSGVCDTAEAVADLCNVSPATVSVYLAVLNGPAEVKELVRSGIATPDTARTLIDVQQRSPEAAAQLIEDGKVSGKVLRDDVRSVQADLKKQEAATKPPKPGKIVPAKEQPSETPAAVNSQASESALSIDVDDGKPAAPGPIAVPAYNVLVGIAESSLAKEHFARDISKHGVAQLADEMVHADPEMAWVHFGRGTDDSMIVPYRCADLVILKIERRE